MALVDINWNPGKKELQVFLILLAIFSGIVATLVYFRTGSPTTAATVVGVGLGIVVIGLIFPTLARYVYVVWMALAFPIGWTVSHLVMAVVYYLVVTPIGLIMRAVGRDPMQRKLDPDAKSYWRERAQDEDLSRYFKQF